MDSIPDFKNRFILICIKLHSQIPKLILEILLVILKFGVGYWVERAHRKKNEAYPFTALAMMQSVLLCYISLTPVVR